MKITILLTSDVHGYIFPTDYISDKEVDIGLLKISSLVKKIKQENSETILIDLGDYIQGSILAQYLFEQKNDPKFLMKIKEKLNYDLQVIGNHEYNFGLNYLKKAVESSNIPTISSNILREDGSSVYKPYEIIEKNGIKIGIIGLTTQYIKNWELPENIKGIEFLSAKETCEKYVKLLRDKVDVLVVAYHGGFERDLNTGEIVDTNEGENEGYQILKDIDGIDILLTGHQHRNIAEVVDDVGAVQPGKFGEFLGKIDIELDYDKNITDKKVKLLDLKNTETDKNLYEKYSYINEELNSWMLEEIGKTDGDMTIKDSFLARLEGCAYANFVNQIQLDKSNAQISSTALFLLDPPGIEKEVTRKNVLNNYPYANTLAVLEISGKDLKQAIAKNSMYFILDDNKNVIVNPSYLDPKPKHYNYDLYSGIEYVIDLNQEEENRVVSLTYNSKIVKDTDKFELVTNQYRALGGGDFPMFSKEKIKRVYDIPVNHLMIEKIKAEGILKTDFTKNFRYIK